MLRKVRSIGPTSTPPRLERLGESEFSPERIMQRILLKSKIHRATVTAADIHYEGSVSIDAALLEAADIVEHEQVQIYDITNGSRLTTYAIPAEPGSGAVQINGAAARLVREGDLVIIASYAQYSDAQARGHTPRVILVDAENRVANPVAAGHGRS